ncbi:MAG: Small GTP-binding domain protein, Rab-/Arf-domain signature [Promethearchaeota archaeon]|nr:MAG: Small GTP-binding domain protein, Rab-/Arf-domain signature [Candidatus Lokiarchaeota archaeon]
MLLRSTIQDETIKVSIIGFPAVGKTTMTKMLAQKETTKKYVPTAGFDLKTVKFGPYKLKIWDFGGQKNYLKKYLEDFVVGSDLIFIVTDSTPKNVLNSRQLIDYAKEIMEEECPIIAIANKQDLCKKDGRMNHNRVADLLHTKTIGLTAIDSDERIRLMKTIENELEQVLERRNRKE